METPDLTRAISAAIAVAVSLDLPTDNATVLHNSNKLALRLTPCDVLARVSQGEQAAAQLEVERAQRLARAGCPVGVVEPSVAPVVYLRDGFAVTLWTYYRPTAPRVPPADYAHALRQLHSGMRTVEMASPRYTDRISEAQQVADDPDLSPELGDADRVLLATTLRELRRTIEGHGAKEQLLHGEPHPGNVLSTTSGPLFIDFETSCSGPVEFDLAHAPETVSPHYPGVNQQLLDNCRQLVLAMVAAWRWRLGDEFPDRREWGHRFLHALRGGPPWPTLDSMNRHFYGDEIGR
ncbi:MAG: aminoglycoside phosphotransferase family protein [Propionibacteriaceae bacterium]